MASGARGSWMTLEDGRGTCDSKDRTARRNARIRKRGTISARLRLTCMVLIWDKQSVSVQARAAPCRCSPWRKAESKRGTGDNDDIKNGVS